MTELLSSALAQADPTVLDAARAGFARVRIAAGRIAASIALVAGGTVLGLAAGETAEPTSAYASAVTNDLGYPWKDAPCEFGTAGGDSCANPNNPADAYDWGEYDANHVFQAYREAGGYEYRNCTDYVAWKLESIGVAPSKVNGLGNGGQWYANVPAGEQASAPQAGDAAVQPGTKANPAGHIAYIESANADGTITISEYNYDLKGRGDKRTGTPAELGLTKFIDFGKHPALPSAAVTALSSQLTPDGNEHIYWATSDGTVRETWFSTAQGAHTNVIKQLGKKVTAMSSQYSAADNLQHIYIGTADGDVDEFWFGTSTGGYHWRLVANVGSAVTAMSSQLLPGYTQHIYEATADKRIWDTWWNPQQSGTYLRDNESNSPIRALTSQVTPDGTVHLYWGNDEGRLHERYLSQSGNTSLSVMGQFGKAITSLSSQTTPDGNEHVYSATSDGVIRETWFNPNASGHTYNSWEAAHIGATINGLSSQYTAADGAQHIFSAAVNANLSETWFKPGQVNGWQVPLDPAPESITAISSQYTPIDGSEHIFWGADDGHVRETWFHSGVVNTWQVPDG